MNVDSLLFISCFLPLVLLLHSLIPRQKIRNCILLAAGLIFCAFGSISGLLLLLAAALGNYLLSLGILAGKRPKLFCAAAVTMNLALLVFYKYLDFLLAVLCGVQYMHPFAFPLLRKKFLNPDIHLASKCPAIRL